MIYFYFFFYFQKIFLCQTCESLNVKETPHNSCNHGSLHLWLQSLELSHGMTVLCETYVAGHRNLDVSFLVDDFRYFTQVKS